MKVRRQGPTRINAVDGNLVPGGEHQLQRLQAATATPGRSEFTTAGLSPRVPRRTAPHWGRSPSSDRILSATPSRRQPPSRWSTPCGSSPGGAVLGDSGRCLPSHPVTIPAGAIHGERQLLLRRHDRRIPDDHRFLVRSPLGHTDRDDRCWGRNPVGDHQRSVLGPLRQLSGDHSVHGDPRGPVRRNATTKTSAITVGT